MADFDGAAPDAVDPLTNYAAVVGERPAAEMQEEEAAPMYRVYKESKIPVSKHRGKLWKSRMQQVDSAMSNHKQAWMEAIRYYRHDQTRRRTGIEDDTLAGSATFGGADMRETENIVFANVSALVPMLYTKNPDAEFTSQSEETKPLADLLERLMKKLAGQKATPGLNLKRKVKRNIVMTTLTNCAWFEVGYVLRDQSSEQALIEIASLSEQFEKAKDQNEIKEIEGKLMALESKIDMLSPSGPWVKTRKPWEVRIDPAATELDLSDAQWAIIEDMMPTSLLRALYGEKKENGDWTSVYEPTHILKASASSQGENLTGDNFVLFSKDGAADTYGYKDDRSFLAAQMTKVYYVWDKATRRCELYSDSSWQFPVWVWDDPLHLDQFFPLVPMEFHTDPERAYAKGEVTYYLDHQDALNLMNNEFARIRAMATSTIVYNADVVKDINLIEQVMAGTYGKKAVPLKGIPEGMKLSDVIAPMLPASDQAVKYFDKRLTLESIDRVSGVAAVQRGVEYKTNTTNRAIESYESQQQTRADEKMDSIEESVGGVLWLVAQMCLQFMTREEVATLIGQEGADAWQTIEPKDIPLKFSPRVIGGSTLKPSSRAKKEQAMQISQVVGQFAKATPAAAMVALKVLATAFNDTVVISEQDWAMVMQGIQAQMQQGMQQGQPPQQGGEGGGNPQEGGEVGDVVKQTVAAAAQVIDRLPPEIKQAVGALLARQVPVQEIAQKIISKLEQPQ